LSMLLINPTRTLLPDQNPTTPIKTQVQDDGAGSSTCCQSECCLNGLSCCIG
jgi:hypothetical protein